MRKLVDATSEQGSTLNPSQIETTLPRITAFTKKNNMISIADIKLDFSSLPESIQPKGLDAQDKQLLQNVIYQLTDPKGHSYPVISKHERTGTFNPADEALKEALKRINKLYKFIEAVKEGDEDKMKDLMRNNRMDGKNFPNPINDNNSLRALKNSLKTDSSFPDRLRMACVPDILNRQQFLIILALLYSLYAQVENEIQDTSKTKEYKEILERIIKENLEKLQEGKQDKFPLAE